MHTTLLVSNNTPYQPRNTVRLESTLTNNFDRTFGAAGNRRTWTFATWVKRTEIGVLHSIFSGGGTNSATGRLRLGFNTDNQLAIFTGDTTVARFSTRVFRDTNAWYHIVWSLNTTLATANDRYKIYVNGVLIPNSDYTINADPALDDELGINQAAIHRVAGHTGAALTTLNGYMYDVAFVDGQELTPASFGFFDSLSIWRPKYYRGTFGTNGFKLDFLDTTSNTAATLGKDSSGNGNNFTPTGFVVTPALNNSIFQDSPTNNMTLINDVDITASASLTLGALQSATGANTLFRTNVELPRYGKWYWEVFNATGGGANNAPSIGVARASVPRTNTLSQAGAWWFTRSAVINQVRIYGNGTFVNNAGTTWTAAEWFRMSWDGDAGRLWIARQVGWYNSAGTLIPNLEETPSLGSFNLASETEPLLPAFNSLGVTLNFNFGQQPFINAPPPQYMPLAKAVDTQRTTYMSDTAFDATIRTGTGAAFSNTEFKFQPDLVVIKQRTGTADWAVYDSVRGVTLDLATNTANAETTEAQGVTAFNINGFSGGTLAKINTNATGYLDLAWRRGIQYGFDIVTYTGDGTSNRLINHGLERPPEFVWVKNRTTGTTNWYVWHKELSSITHFLTLNGTAAEVNTNSPWGTGTWNSAQFMVTNNATNNLNASGANYVAYLWRSVPGFSRFGSYTSTNSATDNAFLYCGFEPALLITKSRAASTDWILIDNARSTFNVRNRYSIPNTNAAETTASTADFISNGVASRSTVSGFNSTAGVHIFAAFANVPFGLSNGV
jgi:hypothetical protein